FLQPIRKIVSKLPQRRQNLFFSATMPPEIGKLANDLLRDPFRVEVTPQATTVDKIAQSLIYVEAARKRALLAELFADEKLKRTIVFTRTKRGADRVAKYLDAAGVPALAIHGDKSQGQRERALASFKAGQARALVATDIAARGIDISGVTHIVNYELPNVPEAYVHRIGRTARAGAEGIAITLCSDDERKLLRDIQRMTNQTIPSFDRRNDKVLGQVTAMDAKLAPVEREERPVAQAKRDPNKPKGQPHRNRRGGRPSNAQGGNAQGPKGRFGGGQGSGPRQNAGGGEARWSPVEA
ncbi:MAG: DEAD/DEAH box helicase, partial [Caulobacteraceae bacterium]